MLTRRQMLLRALGTTAGLSGFGVLYSALAQDTSSDLARGMITPQTEEAIDAGLRYLANAQANDGAWGTGGYTGNVAVTALGGLAMMAAGHQPGRGRYGNNILRAVQFILSNEDGATRGFLNNPRSGGHGPMYGHGFATLFLAEVYGMVYQPELRQRLRDTLGRAIGVIINSQNAEGGWRYRPVRADADLSVTICQIMALRAARNAGIYVPKKVADDCIKYVKACQDRQSGGFTYQARGGQPGFARTAAGVVALYSAGLYDDKSVEQGIQFLARHKPGGQGFFGGNMEHQMHYFYGQYYAVQAMWIKGGNHWREWFPAIREELLRTRQRDGSWAGGFVCPHYNTAMALIILQVPNQYLPIIHR